MYIETGKSISRPIVKPGFYKVKEVGKSDKKGTLVTFKPDKEIFKEVIDFE